MTAMQVWASAVNDAGGICGHKIQVIVQDSQGDPNKAKAQIEDLIQNRHVVAFVSMMLALTGPQVAPTLSKSGVPSFGGECGDVWFSTVGMFTQCATSTNAQSYALVYSAAHFGAPTKKLGLLTCIETPICASIRKSVQKYATPLGVQLVYDQTMSITQVDFTQQCLDMKNAGATMVSLVADTASLNRLGVSCSRQGFNPLYVQPASSITGNTLQQTGLSNLIASVPTFPFVGISGNPAVDEFTKAMKTYDSGDTIGPAHSQGWTSAKLFERVARIAAAKGAITPATLTAAAYTLKNETLGGLAPPLTFTTGQPSPDSRCGFFVSGQGGKYTAPQGLNKICAP